jgi:hypothetical protein
MRFNIFNINVWEKFLIVILSLTVFLLAEGVAQANLIVAPNSLETVEGNSSLLYPLACVGSGGSARYQQVFSASEFASLNGPQLITQIAFRADASQGASSYWAGLNVQINFSTTSLGPDGLSSTFSSNVGPDNITVYSGWLSHTGSTFGEPVPRSFNTIIPLQTPFLYNPSAGNLLLDVKNLSGSSLYWLYDAENTMGDSISSVKNLAFGPTLPSVGTPSTIGLVTQFNIYPVPEPSTLLLLVSGLTGIISLGRKRLF